MAEWNLLAHGSAALAWIKRNRSLEQAAKFRFGIAFEEPDHPVILDFREDEEHVDLTAESGADDWR